MINKADIVKNAELLSQCEYGRTLQELSGSELHNAVSRSVMGAISENMSRSAEEHAGVRRAYYLSAEFLVGRAVYNNLMCLGLTDTVEQQLNERGLSLSSLEEVEDAALGNGGLGRLAACFLDSAATLNLPLDGYGIRYRYGLFKQTIENGFQVESADDWSRFGDPWSIRRDSDAVTVEFADQTVVAVPYDMPIVGYGTENIGTLRLWQSEPTEGFDFVQFNNQHYADAVAQKNRAEDISRVLYPNDDTDEGKILRLKQQYFFSSASLKDIIKSFKKHHGEDFSALPDYVTVQLNDTHPVISIPELIRLLTVYEGVSFDDAFNIARKVFNYTNHTVMQEALEKWDIRLVKSILPEVFDIIKKLDKLLKKELTTKRVPPAVRPTMQIIQENQYGQTVIHMAYLAIFCSSYVNGVAELHTQILKDDVLKDWYAVYPERFQNKTNGITQRRWLGLCNPELSALITELLGSDEWLTNLDLLRQLKPYADDDSVIDRFMSIKREKRRQLADFIRAREGIEIDPDSIFDIQIKRLHEYKRQLLNILAILGLYFKIKDGELNDFLPTTFIFGAKSAPGYARAKGIIKLIGEVARLIDADPVVSRYIKVVFVSNYNVSYAERLVAAADVSEQISTAGTEASGTGNMKLMLNGAVTLGTYDGANVEIVREAGEENNYIFGVRVETIDKLKEIDRLNDERKTKLSGTYSPMSIYRTDGLVHRVLDAMTDGTLDDGGTGAFAELKRSILRGASWHRPDHYFLLLDYRDYLDTKIRLNREIGDRREFARKCFLNMCSAGLFSSDRTIRQYAKDIWHIEPTAPAK